MHNQLFANRLKQSMKDKNLKQIELLRAAEQKGLKLGKSHVSQYVSGKTIPRDNVLNSIEKSSTENKNIDKIRVDQERRDKLWLPALVMSGPTNCIV